MNGKHIVGKYLVALGSLAAAGTVLAQDAAPQAPTGQLSRVEVVADLNLWKRVGIEAYTNRGDSYEFFNPAYERALAEYQRLRNGPLSTWRKSVVSQTSAARRWPAPSPGLLSEFGL